MNEEMIESQMNSLTVSHDKSSEEEKVMQKSAETWNTISQRPLGALQLAPDDADNPRNWDIKKKITIASLALLAPFTATLGTPIYVAAITDVAIKFHTTAILAISPISFYGFGIGIGALLGTAGCEIYGRTIVYRFTLPLALIFTLVGGFAKNFETLAIARSLAGLFMGPSLTVSIGLLNDLWEVSLEKTGTLFAVLYGMFTVWATMIGPMISYAIQRTTWQWTFWADAIFIGVIMVWSFLIPETYAPQIYRIKARKSKLPLPERGSALTIFLTATGRPFHMLVVEPIVFPTALVMSVTQAIVFAYYVEYELLFRNVYKFSEYEVGMAFAPLLVGSIFAMPIMAASDRLLYQPARAEALRLGTSVLPEKRLYPAIVGSIIQPIALFWLAWTGRESVHWIVPILSGIFFGCAYVLNIFCLPLYVNDVYMTHYGASVQAANNFMRFSIASSFPLFTQQMVHRLGFDWATTLFAFIALAMIPIPWVFFKWGPRLRQGSRYLKSPSKETK